ncbi:hypothetical protein COU61_03115 [Candidatus Pacearchaeota archaeon CG10_big_fil_rev_8_21_14_0_10_35_13]|nr:MAG: hypothetical protein COU61_03115 [Candidatus Pacearchaeota archaeon CG10_big_fil_rev_8_21_14_0_10_35_13]
MSLDSDLLRGYSYTPELPPLNERFTKAFLDGVLSLSLRNDFLFSERRVLTPDLDSPDFDQVIDQLLIDESSRILDDGYSDELDVELGRADISVLDFYTARKIFMNVHDHGGIITPPFSKPDLRLLLELNNDIPSQGTPINCVESSEGLSEYLGLSSVNASEAILLFSALPPITSICRVFEECQALQTNDPLTKKLINWEIRTDKDFPCDSPDDAVRIAHDSALAYHREKLLLSVEKQVPRGPRKYFDDKRISYSRDESRLRFAGMLGILDGDLVSTSYCIGGKDYEYDSFARQYRTMSSKDKKSFDRAWKEFFHETCKN